MTTFGSDVQQNTYPDNDDLVDVNYGNEVNEVNNDQAPPTYEENDPHPTDNQYVQEQDHESQEAYVDENEQQQQQYNDEPQYNNQQQQEYNTNNYEQPKGGSSTDSENNNQAAAPADDNINYDEPEDLVAQTQTQAIDDSSSPTSTGDNEYTPFFSDYIIRTLYISIMFFLFCVCSLGFWTSDYVTKDGVKDDLEGPFALSAAADLFIFFGSLAAMTIAVCQKCSIELPFAQICVYITMGLYVLGGVLYLIGGMAVAAGYNTFLKDFCKDLDDDKKGYCSAFAGIWFVEGTLVGGLAIIFGVDIWKKFMARVPLRIYVNIGFYIFISLVGFFCYAIVSTNMGENADGDGSTGTVAAGYFFVFIMLVIYLVIILIPFVREKLKTSVIDFFYAIIFLLFGLLLVIGYWAVVGDIDDIPLFGGDDDFDSAAKGYFVGISFVTMFMMFFIACDMQLGKYLTRFVSSPAPKSDGGGDADADEYGQGNQMYGDSQGNNGEDY